MTSVYPIFDASMPSGDGFNGSHLSQNFDELDQLADSAGLVSLASFIDARTMALEVLEEDQLPENCPPVCWYLAQEGLSTVQGLLWHYQHPDNEAVEHRPTLVAELEHLEVLLKQAESKGAKFHLLVDI